MGIQLRWPAVTPQTHSEWEKSETPEEKAKWTDHLKILKVMANVQGINMKCPVRFGAQEVVQFAYSGSGLIPSALPRRPYSKGNGTE